MVKLRVPMVNLRALVVKVLAYVVKLRALVVKLRALVVKLRAHELQLQHTGINSAEACVVVAVVVVSIVVAFVGILAEALSRCSTLVARSTLVFRPWVGMARAARVARATPAVAGFVLLAGAALAALEMRRQMAAELQAAALRRAHPRWWREMAFQAPL